MGRMVEFHQYVGRARGIGAQLGGLPHWARLIVGIAAIPGVVLVLLSILAFAVSLLALLLLTVPVYALLKRLTMVGGGSPAQDQWVRNEPSPGVKHVEATIVE
jgi:hypothetical protein